MRKDPTRQQIDTIKRWPVLAAVRPTALVQQMLADAEAWDIESFGDLKDEGRAALAASIDRMNVILADREAANAK